MNNISPSQDNFPQHIDPMLMDALGKVIQVHLFNKTTRIFYYNENLLEEKDSVTSIRKIIIESSYRTTAMNDGSIRVEMFAHKKLIAKDGDRVINTIVPGEILLDITVKPS